MLASVSPGCTTYTISCSLAGARLVRMRAVGVGGSPVSSGNQVLTAQPMTTAHSIITATMPNSSRRMRRCWREVRRLPLESTAVTRALCSSAFRLGAGQRAPSISDTRPSSTPTGISGISG